MATIMPGTIDPAKQAKYPIILSDALLERESKEIFTSVRYNHKLMESSDSALGSYQLKPSTDADPTKYDLSYFNGSDTYEYQGIRKSSGGQYVLIFDAVKKHFVLHQVDSSFDMNLTSAPWDQDPASLRTSHDEIRSIPKPRRKSSSQPKSKSAKGNRTSTDTKHRKVEKPKKVKTPPREATPDAEDEDSDDGLTIEYPGGAPPQRFQPNSSLIPQRREKEELSEESDADAEYEEDDDNERNGDVDILELPSPVANAGSGHVEEEEEVDLDLAAELEQALEKETGARADESSESEEE